MGTTYKIQQGDTLSSIANKHGLLVSDLQTANGIKNPNLIIAGNTLTIPTKSPTADIKESINNPTNSKLYDTLISKDTVQEGTLGGSGGTLNSNASPGLVGSSGTVGTNETQNSGYSYTPFAYKDFAESEQTKGAYGSLTNANDALTNLGDFNWVDQGKLDDYTSQYQNRDPFSYDFNTDALYQQYKDKYIKQAKMASADVMGQAAAMNGGYGSSYAQTVGNQAYQSSLEQLNDVIPELYQLAYDKYNQEGQNLLNSIGLLKDERAFAYGQYNDEYTKLANDRDYWSNMYNNLYNRDYSQYANDRSMAQTEHSNNEAYKYQAHRDAVADQQWQTEFDEAKRQYDESMAFSKQQYEDAKKASSSGSSGSGGSGGSGGNAALQHVASMSSAEIVETMQAYSLEQDNTGLAAFLDDCVASGRLTQDQADNYYAKYRKDDTKGKTDTTVTPTYSTGGSGGGKVGTRVDMIN